jgi:hypothetical protein
MENHYDKPDNTGSKGIHTALLERRYPKVKELLCDKEVLLSVSERKPLCITGLFCITIGIIFAVQLSAFFLLSYPQWSIPGLLVSVACVWAGVRLAFLIKNECVFITDNRIVHWRVDMLGRLAGTPLSISLSEITGVRLLRDTLMFQRFLNKDGNSNGDILIRKKNGGTYLVPSLKDGAGLSEILMAELPLYRIKRAEQ